MSTLGNHGCHYISSGHYLFKFIRTIELLLSRLVIRKYINVKGCISRLADRGCETYYPDRDWIIINLQKVVNKCFSDEIPQIWENGLGG